MAELPEVLQAVVVGPGDKLVMVLPEATSRGELEEAQKFLDAHLGPDRSIVAAGDIQLAVIRKEPS